MAGAAAQTEHVEDVADAVAGRGAEVGDDEAPARLEHAHDLGEAALLQLDRQVVQHQARQHDVEASVGGKQRIDAGHLETGTARRAARALRGQRDHLRREIDPQRLSGRPCRLRRRQRQSARSASDVEDPLAGDIPVVTCRRGA